jgi:trk system potassium uptake protein TrkA
MDVVICGAGEVGSHAAEMLTSDGCSVTLIDTNADRLRGITESLDVRVLTGTAADAGTLREAGVDRADLIVGATNIDEVNLVVASMGRALGARRAIARVHHSSFLDSHGFDYEKHFNIDRLICPEFTTAGAIARSLRNPAALAIEDFAGGRIVMNEIVVSEKSPAIDHRLSDIPMPRRTRLAAVSRQGRFSARRQFCLSKGRPRPTGRQQGRVR